MMIDGFGPVVAGARQALSSTGEFCGEQAGRPPRYDLFNAANSICSQKVRTVLAQHELAYLSHTLNIFQGQTYLPGYVRLRMAGCARFGGALAARHTGSSSASAGGCDGAVVPTLVDWHAEEVVVDSLKICCYLDDQVGGPAKLRPDDLADAIDEQLALVDNLPNYQLLMGRMLDASADDATREGMRQAISRKKVELLDRYIAENASEPLLVRAYAAKRTKELSAANALFSADAMHEAYQRVEQSLRALEDMLRRGRSRWLFGQVLTLADLFWGVQLLRLKNMGAATFWDGGRLPGVAALSAATEALPAIRTAILEWPGAMF